MPINDLLALAVAIAISEFAGVVGSIFTVSAIPSWYAKLAKPKLNPPNWIFGPVWTTLYALMGISSFLIWRSGWEQSNVRDALLLFFIQLALNASWSIAFFGWRRPIAALVIIAVLWATIAGTMIAFGNISAAAGYLLLPYLLWTTFAAYLNFEIVRLNEKIFS